STTSFSTLVNMLTTCATIAFGKTGWTSAREPSRVPSATSSPCAWTVPECAGGASAQSSSSSCDASWSAANGMTSSTISREGTSRCGLNRSRPRPMRQRLENQDLHPVADQLHPAVSQIASPAHEPERNGKLVASAGIEELRYLRGAPPRRAPRALQVVAAGVEIRALQLNDLAHADGSPRLILVDPRTPRPVGSERVEPAALGQTGETRRAQVDPALRAAIRSDAQPVRHATPCAVGERALGEPRSFTRPAAS